MLLITTLNYIIYVRKVKNENHDTNSYQRKIVIYVCLSCVRISLMLDVFIVLYYMIKVYPCLCFVISMSAWESIIVSTALAVTDA